MKLAKIFGAAIVLAVALVWIHRTLNPKPADEVALPHAGVGQVLAEQAAKAINDRGRVVLVHLESGSVESRAQLKSFRNTLARHKDLRIVATKTVGATETQMGSLGFQQFAAIVSEYANVDVIVCCVGVASLTEAQLSALSKTAPKLVVANWPRGDVERGMRAGLIQAAVTSRWLTSLPTDHPRTALEWFDRYYNLVTPETN